MVSSVPAAQRSLLSYVLGRFTGRAFVDYAADKGLHGSTVVDILSNAYCDMKADDREIGGPECFFSDSFEPQDVHKNMACGMSKEEFLKADTLKKKFNVENEPVHLQLKDPSDAWRDKRAVMAEMRDQPGAGPFVAKNTFRIMCCFKPVLPSDMEFTECGNGARAFLLLARGYPQGLLHGVASQTASDFFNTLVQELKDDMEFLFERKLENAFSKEHREWLSKMRDELIQTPEAVQFFACESIKVLRYIVRRSKIYEYEYRAEKATRGKSGFRAAG